MMNRVAAPAVLGILVFSCYVRGLEPLPLPAQALPDEPAFAPAVVTAGDRRMLFSHTDVSVRYDAARRQLVVSHPEWWVINYPLQAIEGLEGRSDVEIAELLFGESGKGIRNWYVKTRGVAPPEPPEPLGPAPIALSPNPSYVVDGDAPKASDAGPGTFEQPLKTIGAALAKAKPGDIVRVCPGIYREALNFDSPGAPDAPVRLEGKRDANGRMPVVSGNDPFLGNAWAPVQGLPGVFRAGLFTDQLGVVSMGSVTLEEVSWPSRLQPGEFCLNRASHEFLKARPAHAAMPREGLKENERTWRKIVAAPEGMLSLGGDAANAVLFASTWVWVSPKAREDGVLWDPRFPEPITGKLGCKGPFRAFRQTGTSLRSQVNKYRVWINGELCPSAWEPGKPRAHHNYGKSDRWQNFVLKEGWNHMLFQFDTTTKPEAELSFRFGVPKGIKGYVCSANPPADPAKPGAGEPVAYVSEALLLGPFSATPDLGVYVRLPDARNPNTAAMELAKRTLLAQLDVPFVEVRGLEFRHGACFQQRAQLNVSAEGCVVEGCLFLDSEVRGISVSLSGMDQNSAPIVVRNNWVLNPGGVGIAASGSSKDLTPENQDKAAPGRGRMLCEHNVVINNNCHGYPRFWESGGFKMFRLTGCVLRQNTFIGGDGPAIWLDWEHYGNRVEGNLSLDGTAFCVGVEASPGPNLVANNLAVNLHTGGVWFRHGVLAWSSHAVWAIHNTIDGRWNDAPAWQGKTGAGGIYLHEGGPDRNTRWKAVPKRQAIINNLISGVDEGDVIRRWGWNPDTPEEGNHHDTRKAPWNADNAPRTFRNAERLDYRLTATAVPRLPGTRHPLARHVRHDFYGLLRHPDLPAIAGACRVDPPVPPDVKACVEIEFTDGTMKRLY